MHGTVFLVDDDLALLHALSEVLDAHDFQVRAFASAEAFLDAYRDDAAACAVLDINLPGLSGIEAQRVLRKRGIDLPIIFLTGHGDISTTVRAMRGGAEDFLEKRAPKEQLIATIRRALDRDTRERASRAQVQELRARFNSLTAREREVLGHVVRGKLNKQIAADLGIHERTVKLHRTAITTKLRVGSVAELTRLVHEAGMFADHAPTFPKGQ